MINHPQVKLQCFGIETEVDEGLAELLQLIWKLQIATINSCQENQPGIAWIEFQSADDASLFLNHVALYPPDDFKETLYGRITQISEKSWVFNCTPQNYGVKWIFSDDTLTEEYLGFNDFEFSVSIRFPVSDIPLIVEILKKRDT